MSKKFLAIIVAIAPLGFVAAAEEATQSSAQNPSASLPVAESRDGVPLGNYVEAYAKAAQKHVIIDPRVRGQVTALQVNPNRVSKEDLNAILRVHGFAAIEVGGSISVIPEANVRSMPLPTVAPAVTGLGEDEIVATVMPLKKLNAPQLVPILRPILPQYAHLAADAQSNQLLVIARVGNIKTLQALLREFEKNAGAAVPPGVLPPTKATDKND